MAKFLYREYIGGDLETARFGTTSAQFADADKSKAVKLVADSQYGLCALGDPIEGFCVALDSATADGFRIGSLQDDEFKQVTYDGAEATGTGTAAIGDYVVCGTPVALGTALSSSYGQNVRTATHQPGSTPAAWTDLPEQFKVAVYGWRIVSLGDAATGAVGTEIVIKRVNY